MHYWVLNSEINNRPPFIGFYEIRKRCGRVRTNELRSKLCKLVKIGKDDVYERCRVFLPFICQWYFEFKISSSEVLSLKNKRLRMIFYDCRVYHIQLPWSVICPIDSQAEANKYGTQVKPRLAYRIGDFLFSCSFQVNCAVGHLMSLGWLTRVISGLLKEISCYKTPYNPPL